MLLIISLGYRLGVRRLSVCCYGVIFALIFLDLNGQTILQQWLFNEANGTGLSATSNEVAGGDGGVNFTSGIAGVSVQNGALQIRSSASTNAFANTTAKGINSGIYQLDLNISDWNMVNPATGPQGLYIGFVDNVGADIAADIGLAGDATGFSAYGRALGTGAVDTGSQHFGTSGTNLELRLIMDLDNRETQFYYRDSTTGGNFVSTGTGTIDSARDWNHIRIRPTNNWSEGGEYINVDSMAVSEAYLKWDGGTDGSWSNAGNWEGSVYRNNMSIIIAAGASNYTQTLDGNRTIRNLEVAENATLNAGGAYALTFNQYDSTIEIAANKTLTLNANTTVTTGSNLEKKGAGTLELVGTLAMDSSDTLNISGGTLLLGADQTMGAIEITSPHDTQAALGLNGFNLNAVSLDISGASNPVVIDFGNGSSHFTLSGNLALGANELHVWNWNGNPWQGGGNEQFIVSGTVDNLEQLFFFSDAGNTRWSSYPGVSAGAHHSGDTGELTPPVPEAKTWITSGLIFAFIFYRQRKQLLLAKEWIAQIRRRKQ